MNRRVRDPYARWCGRRDAVRRLPIPIMFSREVCDMFGNLFFLIIGLVAIFVGIKNSDVILILCGVVSSLGAVGTFYFFKTGKSPGQQEK